MLVTNIYYRPDSRIGRRQHANVQTGKKKHNVKNDRKTTNQGHEWSIDGGMFFFGTHPFPSIFFSFFVVVGGGDRHLFAILRGYKGVAGLRTDILHGGLRTH